MWLMLTTNRPYNKDKTGYLYNKVPYYKLWLSHGHTIFKKFLTTFILTEKFSDCLIGSKYGCILHRFLMAFTWTKL